MGFLFCPPLITIVLYHTIGELSIGFLKFAFVKLHKDLRVLGKKFVQLFLQKPLDKMLKVWYNINFGPGMRQGPAQMPFFTNRANKKKEREISPSRLDFIKLFLVCRPFMGIRERGRTLYGC